MTTTEKLQEALKTVPSEALYDLHAQGMSRRGGEDANDVEVVVRAIEWELIARALPQPAKTVSRRWGA